jgi:hypothetical protein
LTAAKRSKGYQLLNETARPADSVWAGIRFRKETGLELLICCHPKRLA